MAPDPDEPNKKQVPKPNEGPTKVREPDNTRPPGEPTPKDPSKPFQVEDNIGEGE